MAIYHRAKQLIIPPGINDPKIDVRVGVLHVDAGDNPSLYEFFRDRSGGIESHFHIPKVERIEQYRDTAYEADANYLANPFAMSVETQGLAAGIWNEHQLKEIQDLMIWADKTDQVPLQPALKWDGEGWGYHIQFGSPGKWTDKAKSCPGPLRIQQFNDILVPWMKEQPVMAFTEKDRQELAALRAEVKDLTSKVTNHNTREYKRFKELRTKLDTLLSR